MKEGYEFLADVRNQAQVLLKRSCTLGKLVNTQTKGNIAVLYAEITFVSVLTALNTY